jgi:hypothetical protein
VRALGVVKSNLALKPETLLWSRPTDSPILWHGISAQPIDALLGSCPSASPRANAESFLRELLAAESLPSWQILALGKAAGLSERTLRRAADAIGVKPWKAPGPGGRWYWRLPKTTSPLPTDSLLAGPEELGHPLTLPAGQLGQLPLTSETQEAPGPYGKRDGSPSPATAADRGR